MEGGKGRGREGGEEREGLMLSFNRAITCHLQMGGFTVVFGEDREIIMKVIHLILLLLLLLLIDAPHTGIILNT